MTFATAATALKAISKAFSVVGENVATSKDNGIKPKNTTFVNTVSGNLNGGSYSPNTVTAVVNQNNDLLGNIKDSTSQTHLALDSAKGFFVVTGNKDNPTSDIRYTRDGDFTPDSEGNLRNSAGFYLMGWKLDDNGNIPPGTNDSVITSLETINVTRVSGTFTPTTQLDIRVNLPATAALNDIHAVNSTVIDSLGVTHNVVLTYTKTANPNEWDLTVTSADSTAANILQVGGANAGTQYLNMTIQFDNTGRLVSYNGAALEVTPPQIDIPWNNTAAANSLITIDFGAVGTTTALRVMGDQAITTTNDGNGRQFSTVDSTLINTEGDVFSVFRNSDKQKTFKVALANFSAPNFLEPQSGNTFTETGDSGNSVLGKANDAGYAKIVAGKLEGNPTDLAEELTKMIELQHLFAANTRSIQTEDQMLTKLGQV